MDNNIPRRIRVDLYTPAEKAIYEAVQEVEKAGADVRLTEAVILLHKAKDKVADFVDGIDIPKVEQENKSQLFLLSYHLSNRSDEGWGNMALVSAKNIKEAEAKLIQSKTYKKTDALSSTSVSPDHITCLNIF